ncbi:MAG: hypothetical protein GX842_06060 [Spirochaetales bacterium]|jgi:tetratricopeptide (TPR) repeat protein|nr:hypothetical protein [Spirochaetales bacterium]
MGKFSLLLLVVLLFSGCHSGAKIDQYILKSSEQSSYQESKEVLLKGLEKWPADERLLYNLAIIEAYQGEFDASIETFEELNALTNHANIKYLKALAGVALADERGEVALESYLLVIQNDPLDSQTRFKAVELLIKEERYGEAFSLAYQAYLNGDYSKKVFEELAKIEELRGNDPSPWLTLKDL